ncbi:hypothetical protein D3C86_1521710 [compost metagenome]
MCFNGICNKELIKTRGPIGYRAQQQVAHDRNVIVIDVNILVHPVEIRTQALVVYKTIVKIHLFISNYYRLQLFRVFTEIVVGKFLLLKNRKHIFTANFRGILLLKKKLIIAKDFFVLKLLRKVAH